MFGSAAATLFALTPKARAQQLEPRAYSSSPVGMNFIGLAAAYTSGGVLTDPSIPVENVNAKIPSVAPFYLRTFDVFGRVANVQLVVPFARATVTGDVEEMARSVERTGFLDPYARLATNLIGMPALTPRQFQEHPPETTLGTSVTVTAPLGQYDATKFINLGTNRWAFRADLGFSHPVGRWIFELQTGAWFFTDNDDFRGQVRKQNPLAAIQIHVVYNFHPGFWAAADFTVYGGGSTKVGDVSKNDRQANARFGLTLAVPITSSQSIKLGFAQGATTRIGANFTTLALSWTLRWY